MKAMTTPLMFAAALLIACGSSSPKTSTTDQTTDTPPATEDKTPAADDKTPAADAPKVAWADMTPKQKGAYMKNVVVPRMTKVFQEFDPVKYEKVKCTTCHGDGAMEGKFDMPNADIHQLSAGFAEEKQKYPKMLGFMAKRVVPEMAKLLGKQPYDPATQKGFGCFGCHTAKK